MKYKAPLLLLQLITSIFLYASVPERTNWWKFDDPTDLLRAETNYTGSLSLHGTHQSVTGPTSGNGAVMIGQGSYYTLSHLIAANGGGSFVNEYSIQVDFKVSATTSWHCFFQTDPGNTNDGDLFINPSGNIGVAAVGYANNTINAGEWYRLVISVRNGYQFRYFLDGNLILDGNVQEIDGRFSLDNSLLMFADEDGEDGEISCSELSLWDVALTSAEINELGGFGHTSSVFVMSRVPYLQARSETGMTICWHDSATYETVVKYGLTPGLGYQKSGTSEAISFPFTWHSVRLTGLNPDSRYFYRVFSGGDSSLLYSFKTQKTTSGAGKRRYLVLGDTHASDTTMAGVILRAAGIKMSELYGSDLENHLDGILHTGDIVVSGSVPSHYTTQYFKPMSVLSPFMATQVVAGNHEGENSMFYRYLKLDELSAFPDSPELNEKIWKMRDGNSVFIGLNTNITEQYGTTQSSWLDQQLDLIENDQSIDFVFILFHHPPFSELWKYATSYDSGPDYVENTLFPIIRKYSKVRQLHYGHTHGFERGTIRGGQPEGDFRIICGGGSGGPLDPWGEDQNIDITDVHITISNYFFQILEIDPAEHSYLNTVYSLGNLQYPTDPVVLDSWYKKENQAAPAPPGALGIEIHDDNFVFVSTPFSGPDSLMTIRIRVVDSLNQNQVIVDSLIHWKNVYGINGAGYPVDLNQGKNMYRITLPQTLFTKNTAYYVDVQYRDHNLKWSTWSPATLFKPSAINTTGNIDNIHLRQNYPNPFQNSTTIEYNVINRSRVVIQVFDSNLRLVDEINEGVRISGSYKLDYSNPSLNDNTYFYKLITSGYSGLKKMVKLR